MHRIRIITFAVALLGLASFAQAEAPCLGSAGVTPAACASAGGSCPTPCGPCPQSCPLPCADGGTAAAVTVATTF